jgi:NADH:ubiquinone oxidoreductase subunit 6 (subunit J)
MTVASDPAVEQTSTGRMAAQDGLRQALLRWGAQARAAELVKLIVVPGAVAVVGGFIVMFLGWYGAARSYPEVAQIPYIISGGFVGLALVVLGGLLLASAVWIAQLGRMQRAMEQRFEELAAPPTPDAEDSRPARRRPGGRS